MRAAVLMVAATASGLAACSAPTPPPTSAPAVESPAASSQAPETDLSAATVAYLKAWAANDVPTMISNAAPNSPAHGYATYWGRVFAAGRQDTGSADLIVRRDSAVLQYPDARYRLVDFDAGAGGLRSWVSRPGGPVADRIVAEPSTRARVGGLTVTVHEQYVNTTGGLRVTLSVRRPGSATATALAAPTYRSAAGATKKASLGAQDRTGVVPMPRGRSAALAAVPAALPGGDLTLVAYGKGGRVVDRAIVDLPG